MNVRCPRCGGYNVRNARVIVDQETTYTTIQVQGVVNGNAVQYPQNVSTQSRLAQNLTADEPRKGINWFTVFCLLMIMPPLVLLSFASCAGLEASNGNRINIQSFTLLLACVAAIIVVSIIMSVVSKKRTKSFNQKYNDWLDLLGRRYHCSDCGNITQF